VLLIPMQGGTAAPREDQKRCGSLLPVHGEGHVPSRSWSSVAAGAR
jgi:hypothetical protein